MRIDTITGDIAKIVPFKPKDGSNKPTTIRIELCSYHERTISNESIVAYGSFAFKFYY